MRPTRRLTACLAVLLLTGTAPSWAAEPDDVPTYEQIEAVTKTTEVDGEDEAYALDDVVVNATRRAEVAYRHIQIALERRRSDKLEDADLTVCRKVTRPGSHILQTMCATNRTWNYIRMKSTRDVLGNVRGGYAPYPVTEGPVYRINQGYLNKMSQRFDRDTDHTARVKQLMAADAAERMSDEHGTGAEEVARFATAFGAISRLKSADDAALERVIVQNGLTVERYNELVARLETSPRFKERVAFAMQAAN